MKRAKKPITEEQKQQIIAEITGGEPISRVAKKNGIGFSRIEKWLMDIDFIRPKADKAIPVKLGENNREQEARKQTIVARAYWDKFKIGQAVRLKIERPRKDEEKGDFLIYDGNIIDKNKHYFTVLSNNRRVTVSFADVMTRTIKIIPQVSIKTG